MGNQLNISEKLQPINFMLTTCIFHYFSFINYNFKNASNNIYSQILAEIQLFYNTQYKKNQQYFMGSGGSKGISAQQMNAMMSEQRRQMCEMFDKMNQQYTSTIEKLISAMEKEQDKAETPEEYHAIQEKYENQFVQSLRTIKFAQVIKPKVGKHYCFIGPTSVGKSSLWNALFGLKLPIGLGSCTKEAKEIKIEGDITYWDAPGINKDFGFYKPHHLGFFNDLDKIFVLFQSQIDSVALILKVFNAMKKNIVLVRTKCDNHNSEHEKTIQQELDNDLQQARKYYPACQKVYGVGKGTYGNIQPELK